MLIDNFLFLSVLIMIGIGGYLFSESLLKRLVSLFIIILFLLVLLDLKIQQSGGSIIGINLLLYILPIPIFLLIVYASIKEKLAE